MWIDKNGVKHYSDTGPDENTTFEERGEYELDEPKKETIKDRVKKLRDQRAERSRQREKLYKKTEATPKNKYELMMVRIEPDGKNHIKVSGRVTGGEPCRALKVDAFLYSNNGGRSHVIAVLKRAGGAGSKLFNGKDYVFDHARDDWKISSVYFNCMD